MEKRRGRQTKRCEDSMKEWIGKDYTSSTRAAKDMTRQKGVVAKSPLVHQPTTMPRLVYGLQQYGHLNNSCPLCFLFCSVL